MSSSLTDWLKELVRVQSSGRVEIRPSRHGGLGGFALVDLKAGDVVFEIPNSLILSSSSKRVVEHPVVKKLVAADLDSNITLETLLFVYIISVRQEHANNDDDNNDNDNDDEYNYLTSLPADPPLLLAKETSGTNVGDQVVKDSAELVSQLARIRAVTVTGTVELETLTLKQLTKAKYNYNSRRYPLAFGGSYNCDDNGKKRDRPVDDDDDDDDDEDVEIPTRKERRVYDATQGCLCPLLDILNHREGNKEQLSFDYTSDPLILKVKTRVTVTKGDEIYSNYGCGISNDQLLLQFGFCDMALPSVFTVVLGGERFDLRATTTDTDANAAGLPAHLVSDGGHGLHGHLSKKLAALLAADESSNPQVVWYMTQQRKLLEELLAQCDALDYSGSSSEEE
eukprot:CAMPEP_0198284288 /NCGR_PEP_ID=MMETSP1449-20131203/3776_1 /TAXON_ID=420275 /ORGANISM="Attheya septentrionalis, Strain CCMP2084" /LENGTH=395 /DNA_ID=CAMNT_0043981287 /DNA_START=25 /DNA_END=1212 /DNA_ORIENTATION=+